MSPLFFSGVLEVSLQISCSLELFIGTFTMLYLWVIFQAVVAALFMNIYIVGLNQLSDIDIDKVGLIYDSYWKH